MYDVTGHRIKINNRISENFMRLFILLTRLWSNMNISDMEDANVLIISLFFKTSTLISQLKIVLSDWRDRKLSNYLSKALASSVGNFVDNYSVKLFSAQIHAL